MMQKENSIISRKEVIMEKRVVITGMGAITPIGKTVDEYWKGIKNGVNGIDIITSFDIENYDVKLAAEVKDFDPKLYMDPKEAKRMDRFCQLAMAAAKEAMESSKLDLDQIDHNRLGVIVGSGIGGFHTFEQEEERLLSKGPKRTNPLTIPMMISNMAAGNIAIKYQAKGICTNIVTACATGNQCIGEAYRNIKYGYSDVIISGGAEACITPLAVAGFTNLTALSKSTDKNRASIPFDKERNGFVMGEGAGILILEELEHAKNRGANILAEVVGYGTTCDAYHMTSPAVDGEGAARAMNLAIEDAKITPKDISYINAHGTSTAYNDKFETLAVKTVFGEDAYHIPVSSTKSMTGHLLGAAGAIEAIICAKAVVEDFIPPTIGYQVEDEDCDLDIVPNEGRNAKVSYAMSNAFGFGGHNATIILKKYL